MTNLINKLFKSSLIKFGFLYTLFNGIQKGVGFIIFMYLAKKLSIPDYAQFGKYYALFSMISMISYAGIIEVTVGSISNYNSVKRRYSLFKLSNSLFFILSFSLLFFILITKFFFIDELNLTELGLVWMSSILSTYFLLQSQLVRLNEEHKVSIALTFLPAISAYILGLVAVIISLDPLFFFLGTSIGYTFSIFIYLHPSIVFFGISKRINLIISFIKKLPPFLGLAFLSWVMGYGIIYVIDFFFDEAEVGTYLFLYTLSSIIQLVGTSMNQVYSPKFFNNFNKLEIPFLEKGYRTFSSFQGLILGVTSAFLLLMAPYLSIISESYSVYVQKSQNLAFLFMGYIALIPWWKIQNYFIVSNKGYTLIKLTFFASFLGFLVWVFLLKIFGSPTIYIGFFIFSVLKSIFAFYFSRKEWKLNFEIYGQLIGITLVLLTLIVINGV